jgi:hypothetical protein
VKTLTDGPDLAADTGFLWQTVVDPRLGCGYDWSGSFSATDVRQGTDCSGAVSAELSALMRGPAMLWRRQFWTGTFAGIYPGQTGPFAGIEDTAELVCIADPTTVPDDYAMIIAINQTGPDPAYAATAHMMCRVGGVDIEMGGMSNNYHTSQSDPTCSSVFDAQFNQFFYLPGAGGTWQQIHDLLFGISTN